MKKIIATIVTISMIISSLQVTSFAQGKPLCGGEELTLKCLEKDGYTKSEAKKLIQLSKDLRHAESIKESTGVDMTQSIRDKFAVKFSREKHITFDSILLAIDRNGYIPAFIVLGAGKVIWDYWKKLKTRYQVGKVETAVDPVATVKTLDALMSEVKGQEKAKKKIRSIVLNIADRNGQHTLNKKKSRKAGPGATVIYMVGPSGVGKSFSADVIRKVLSGFSAEPLIIEASDVDKSSHVSPTDQLFGMRQRQVNGSIITEYSPFINRIRAIPNSVVIINEYDKMHTRELDEKLRTIMDQGYINVNGEKIDCSAATFIITSNESSGSVNKGNLETDNQDDGTGSRTFINHDKAFLNRLKLVEFDSLSEGEYKKIAMEPFLQLVQKYKQQYKVNIDLNGTVDSIAQKVAELNKGARPIFSYVDDLNNKLLNEVVLNRVNDNAEEEVEYKVSFDKSKEEFVLEKVIKEVKENDINKVA